MYEHPSGEPVDGVERGYGWAYIESLQLPGIHDPEDVGHVIEHPSAIHQHGDYTIVIGDNPAPGEDGRIVVRLLGGTIVSAAAHDTVEDPLGREVYIPQAPEDLQHILRHDITYGELVGALENPDEIWRGSQHDFYVAQLDDGSWIVVKVFTHGGVILRVSTVAPQQTRNDVDNYLENRINDLLRRIYQDDE